MRRRLGHRRDRKLWNRGKGSGYRETGKSLDRTEQAIWRDKTFHPLTGPRLLIFKANVVDEGRDTEENQQEDCHSIKIGKVSPK